MKDICEKIINELILINMNGLFQRLKPEGPWRTPALIISGAILGLFISVLYVSKAHSYLSDEPETCMNCHIMAPQYATWEHSAHREKANCNDCHVPHNNVFNKYYFKAMDGLRHATMFTLRREPQVIRIREQGRDVVKDNCLRCHPALPGEQCGESRDCWDCHRETPHGRVNSLSSVPYARVPVPSPVSPSWISTDSK